MLTFNRICWLDLETTGTDPQKHDITQIAMLFEVNGKLRGKHCWTCRPHEGREIEESALLVQGRTREAVMSAPHPTAVHRDIIEQIDAYRVQYEKGCRFHIAGFNVGFDQRFLMEWFAQERRGDLREFWFRFWPHTIDVKQTAVEAGIANRLPPVENLKLTTLTRALGIEHGNAHDALSDIEATYALYQRLRG